MSRVWMRLASFCLSVLLLLTMTPGLALEEEQQETVFLQEESRESEKEENAEQSSQDVLQQDSEEFLPSEPETESDTTDLLAEEDEVLNVILVSLQDTTVTDGTAVFMVRTSGSTDLEIVYAWQQLLVRDYASAEEREEAWTSVNSAWVKGEKLVLTGITAENYSETYQHVVYRCVITYGETVMVTNEAKILADPDWSSVTTPGSLIGQPDEILSGEETAGEEQLQEEADFPYAGTVLYEGKDGDIAWYLMDTGELILSGNGSVSDHAEGSLPQWCNDDIKDMVSSITVAEGISRLGSYSLAGLRKAVSISLPDTLVSIGSHALENCTKVRSLLLPEGVKTLDDCALRNCASLRSLELPVSLTYLGEDVFAYCDHLASISVKEGNAVYSGDGVALYSGDGRKILLYPAGRVENTYTVKDGTTSIGNSAFMAADSLEEVTLPASVKTIEKNAFANCGSLSAINLDWVEGIGANAFYACFGFEWIQLGPYVSNVAPEAFAACDSICAFEVADGNATYTAIDGVLFSKDATRLVAFPAGHGMEYAIPTGTIAIEDGAFSMATMLLEVSLPEGIRSIGNRAFYWCMSLQKLKLPASVTVVGESAFANTGLTSLVLPDAVSVVPDSLCYGCSDLKEIHLPARLDTIGASAFYGCDLLQCVEFPATVRRINSKAFYFCTGLKELCIPASVTRVESRAFYECRGLKKVTFLGDSTLDGYAFEKCGALSSITMPCSLKYASTAFQECTGVTYVCLTVGKGTMITYNASTGTYGYASTPWFRSEADSVSVVVEEGVHNVSAYAFHNCRQLTSVSLPESLVLVDGDAFQGCSGLMDVFYAGTQEQWDHLTVEANNAPLLEARLHVAHTHEYELLSTTATCMEAGTGYYGCICGEQYQQSMEALGHAYEEKSYIAPACETIGKRNFICSACGDTYEEILDAQGHDEQRTLEQEPDCTQEGSLLIRCLRCLQEHRETVGALGHDVVMDAGVEATYWNAGVTEGSHCDRCHAVLAPQSETAALRMDLNVGMVSTTSIRLTWKKLPMASGYRLYRTTDPETPLEQWTQVTALSRNSVVSFSDKQLIPGTTYYYSIVPVHAQMGVGIVGKPIVVTTTLAKPSLSARRINNGTNIALSWKPVRNAAGYRVFMDDGYGFREVGHELPPDVVSLILPLSPVAGARFYLEAYSADGAVSVSQTRTMHGSMKRPYLTVKKGIDGASISLTWKSIPGALEYHLYVDDGSGEKGPLIYPAGEMTLVYRESISVAATGSYQLRLVAVAEPQAPVCSFGNTAKVKLALGMPSVKLAKTTAGTVAVSWKEIKGATRYQVEWSTTKNGAAEKTVIWMEGDPRDALGRPYVEAEVPVGKTYYRVSACSENEAVVAGTSFVQGKTAVKSFRLR